MAASLRDADREPAQQTHRRRDPGYTHTVAEPDSKWASSSSQPCQHSARCLALFKKIIFHSVSWAMDYVLPFKMRLGSWGSPDTSLQFPYAHLNILPKLISLFLKPSICIGQAPSACAVQSMHFSLYITQRNELLLRNH